MTDSMGSSPSYQPQVYAAREPIKSAPDAPMLGICLPTRGTAPIEFYISLLQMLHPLNTKLTYCIQKGKLPAAARNELLTNCLERGLQYAFFLDDDVLFPDVTLYRMWVTMQKHPEIALLTGIVPTKLEPTEPLLYLDEGSGAYWDWPMGVLVPIHSAGAGCMIINLNYVKQLDPPYFNDVIQHMPEESGGRKRHTWGHDRFFMRRLGAETDGKVYADTGLLLAHYDVQMNKSFLLPPDSPCFQRPPLGECFVPVLTPDQAVYWRRILPPDGDRHAPFVGYLDWITKQTGDGQDRTTVSLLEKTPSSE